MYRLCSTKTSSTSTASLNSLDTKSAPLLPPPSPTFSLHTALVMAKASGNPAALLTAEMLKQIELLEIKASRFFGGCVQKAKMADQVWVIYIWFFVYYYCCFYFIAFLKLLFIILLLISYIKTLLFTDSSCEDIYQQWEESLG